MCADFRLMYLSHDLLKPDAYMLKKLQKEGGTTTSVRSDTQAAATVWVRDKQRANLASPEERKLWLFESQVNILREIPLSRVRCVVRVVTPADPSSDSLPEYKLVATVGSDENGKIRVADWKRTPTKWERDWVGNGHLAEVVKPALCKLPFINASLPHPVSYPISWASALPTGRMVGRSSLWAKSQRGGKSSLCVGVLCAIHYLLGVGYREEGESSK